MKAFILAWLFCIGVVSAAVAEAPASAEFVTAKEATGRSLPPYVVYRHFLGWVSSLGGRDAKANASDVAAVKSSLPSRVELTDKDLRFLRSEALSLSSELQECDRKAAVIIADYRRRATAATQKGEMLPPVPPELPKLQQEKTALVVQRYIKMQANLEANGKEQLQTYLSNEFAPHISITDLLGQQPRRNQVPNEEKLRLESGPFE
jgi:hypothetical protein